MGRSTGVEIGLLLSVGLSTSVTAAESGRHAAWQSIGPAPPAVSVPVVADPASHTIYIGSSGGGVLKSTNGGATFQYVNGGLLAHGIGGMAVVPNHPDRAYVQAEGFYTTTDGGAHWSGGNWAGITLLMDPENPNILYSSSGPFDYVMKSTDGGGTWFYAANGLGEASVFTLAIDPHNSNVLYAGSQGQGAFKSVDGAVTWTPINVDPFINALLVDPDNGNIVYAGSDRHGIYKSTDGGRSFARVGSPRIPSILSLAKSGQTLYAGTATGGVSESIDGGRSWKNSGIASGYGNALSVDVMGTVYVGTSFDGVLARSPGDDEWRRLGWNLLERCNCQQGAALAVDPGDRDHLFYSTNFSGLLETEDGGRSWTDAGEHGLASNGPRGIAFDPQDPRRVYVGSIWGGGVFKSNDHGKHWTRSKFGSVGVFVSGVAVDPVDHSIYAVTALGNDGLWKSTDYGETFTRTDRVPGAMPGVYIGFNGHSVTVDPHRHTTVYFGDEGVIGGIWRSQDSGTSWVQVDATDNFTSITVDPTDPNIVYASASGAATYPVLKSIDGGTSFQPKSGGLPTGMNTANYGFLLVNSLHTTVLYLGTEFGGMFKSTDAAESWFPINSGLDDTSVSGIAMDPEAPDTVYAASSSVYKTVTGGR